MQLDGWIRIHVHSIKDTCSSIHNSIRNCMGNNILSNKYIRFRSNIRSNTWQPTEQHTFGLACPWSSQARQRTHHIKWALRLGQNILSSMSKRADCLMSASLPQQRITKKPSWRITLDLLNMGKISISRDYLIVEAKSLLLNAQRLDSNKDFLFEQVKFLRQAVINQILRLSIGQALGGPTLLQSTVIAIQRVTSVRQVQE